jgi:multiple sugar transport system permease protein
MSSAELMKARRATVGHRVRSIGQDRREQALTGYLFLLPDVLGLLVFVIGPMLYAFYISLNKWTGFTQPQFVGLDNYFKLVRDPAFWDSLRRTAIYTLGFVPAVYVFALGLALLLERNPKAGSLFRTIYFMPVAISMVVASIVWSFIFEPSYGFLNFIFSSLGLPKLQWLGSVQTAMISVLIVSVWKNVGYFMVILLAGIQDIPLEYYEAARIDGASFWQSLRHITLPLLKPTSLFVAITLMIGALQAFDQIYVLTRGGPAYATYTLLMYIYERAFQFWQFGYSAAISFVLFAIILLFTLLQLRYFRSGWVD